MSIPLLIALALALLLVADLLIHIWRSQRRGLPVQETPQETMHTRLDLLPQRRVSEVMTPWPEVVTASEDEDVATVLARALESGHSRLVLCGEGTPRAVVLISDLAATLLHEGRDARISPSPAPQVPESMHLDTLIRRLQHERAHLAIVLNEYGETTGVVSLEDALEEIVGEIADERDVPDIVLHRTGVITAPGHTPTEDLIPWGVVLPGHASTSLGGLIAETLGRVPHVAEGVVCGEWVLTATEMDGNRVRIVSVAREATV